MAKDFSKNFQGVATRPQLGRMHAIVKRIQRGDYPNKNVLAGEFEVTPRTIQRDITFMRDRERIPIDYDPRKYGYFLSEPVADFPLLQISEGEVVALFVAQKALAQYHGTPFEQPLRVACEKLLEGLRDEFSIAWSDLDAAISFRNIETNPVDLKIFKELSRAVRTRHEVAFDYCKLGAKSFERRRVQPYHLTCVNQQWYVLGHDPVRSDNRTFVLARMQKPKVLATTFDRPKGFSADKWLKGSFGIFSGGKPVEMRIRFDSFAARLVRERHWHNSQEIIPLPGDKIELKLTLTSTVEVLPWILSWGTHAKVLAPPELVRAVQAVLSGTLQQYPTAKNAKP